MKFGGLFLEKLVIQGGNKLSGEINISGAKNAAVAIIPAALLVSGRCRIENIPNIKDVRVIVNILIELGVSVNYISADCLEIDASTLKTHSATSDLVKKMRASYYLLGALLGRKCKAVVALPGGCDFGGRPIDQHIKGFEALGASSSIEHGFVKLSAKKLCGAQVFFDVVSVGATINVMLAAVLAKGTTIIENAAKEPHIVDVANFLNSMGAKIRGAGTDTIKITGVEKLSGGTYSIIPDQIEAGTFMAMVAGAGGDVTIKNVIPKHLESITAKLCEIGAEITETGDSVRVKRTRPITKATVKTMPYPGFPTDMQPQITTLLTVGKGTSTVIEAVWDSRFQYVGELVKMGAQIKVSGQSAIIEGVQTLTGANVRATDLRAGAAMVIAGLMAKGTTTIENIEHIERGYENLVEKLTTIGAKITRTNE